MRQFSPTHAPRAQVGEGPDLRALAYDRAARHARRDARARAHGRLFQNVVRVQHRPRADAAAAEDMVVREDDDALADLRVRGNRDRFGVDDLIRHALPPAKTSLFHTMRPRRKLRRGRRKSAAAGNPCGGGFSSELSAAFSHCRKAAMLAYALRSSSSKNLTSLRFSGSLLK